MNTRQYDLIIIGAGPAGLTAAIYAGRALLNTLLLERTLPGGQLNETDYVENFPGFEEKIAGPQLMGQMKRQAERFGVKIEIAAVTAIAAEGESLSVTSDRGTYFTRTIIVATGTRPRELVAAGAAKFKGRGLSYCATCDGYFFRNKDVLEVGAGDAGLTAALFLSKLVKSVGIVVRHPQHDPNALRAAPLLRQRAEENPKVYFVWNKVITEVLGETHLKAVKLQDLATGKEEIMTTDGVFVNIGHIPATDFLRGTLALDESGYIITDDKLQTNIPGVFAAGDIRSWANRYAQAVVAASDGAVAAIEVEKYLANRR
ncbi:thioredoxin-disulfide reductase [Candidatus Acetothermia bacterium]|jgi:thioredoxin reductase (NADPH)|nr:thioredoxin-disulfide reductase [Candidatus Acetothermia bacterium]MCI2426818.1 thioredoxin-disulfide reductase [Candidatus Acetothermia bacterium]MCI2427856.1 thioredoxin-disulfide reductase [Candidatus Acetothermia bacterium]MCI2428804.1 thioredoxin-disulfide reductase [Candidatus Acetothermia bacterium]